MANIPPQHTYPFPELGREHMFPAAAPINPHGFAGAPQNPLFPPMNAAGNRHQADDNWEDIPPPVEDIAAQQQPQDPQYNNMAHYPPLDPANLAVANEYYDHGVNYHPVVANGVPDQVQAIVPPAPLLGFDYANQHAAAGPVQPERPNQAHVPNQRAAEILRRLANHYLNQPESQVDMVRMGPGPVGGIRVIITVDLADIL